MAKEIILEPGRTFAEFTLLPGHTGKECTITSVSLETMLSDDLVLGIPLLSAAMSSVTDYELALALGKEKGLPVLPFIPIEEQGDILKRLKNYEMTFVEEPLTARDNMTVESAVKLVERYGHSRIPVVDKNNKFLGMFVHQHYLQNNFDLQDLVTKAMISFNPAWNSIPYIRKPDLTVEEAKKLLDPEHNYLVVLDEQDRVAKQGFFKDIEKIRVGAAISTYPGWKERVKVLADGGVDLIVVDTSDADTDWVEEVIGQYKAMGIKAPICAGNIVTYDAARLLMRAGADCVKGGMSGGSICTTAREKAVGSPPMAVAMELARAQKDHFRETGKYVPTIIDGGVPAAADMIIALTLNDAVMCGNYFNKFYEAAGEKYDRSGRETRDEIEMYEVATWGEGSERAMNMGRYSQTRKTFFPEGEEGRVNYRGRLKPNLKKDLIKIRAAMVNAGCMNLKELRENARIQLMSLVAQSVVKETHNIKSVK